MSHGFLKKRIDHQSKGDSIPEIEFSNKPPLVLWSECLAAGLQIGGVVFQLLNFFSPIMLCVVQHFHVVRRHSHRVAGRLALLPVDVCKHHSLPVVVVMMMLYNVLVVVPPDPVTQLTAHHSAKFTTQRTWPG